MFRIRGIQVSLHYLFPLLLAYACYTGWQDAGMQGMLWGGATLITFFACIVLHELGHSFTAMAYGIRVRRILLTPIGGIAEFDEIPRKPSQELLITIAGPMVNFAIAALLWFVVSFPDGWQDDPALSSLGDLGRVLFIWNIRIGLFNLIPAFPMDGGRILRALLATRLSYVRATYWAAMVSKIVAVPCTAWMVYQGNYLAVALFVFIVMAGQSEYRSVKIREQREEQLRMFMERQNAPPPGGEPPPLVG